MLEDIKGLYEKALKEKASILKSLHPLRKEEEKAIKKLHLAEAELKEIRDKIVKIENEKKLAEVSKIISMLAPQTIRLKAEA